MIRTRVAACLFVCMAVEASALAQTSSPQTVHTLSVNLNPNSASPQADGNGGILR